jgi:hypothetical protein
METRDRLYHGNTTHRGMGMGEANSVDEATNTHGCRFKEPTGVGRCGGQTNPCSGSGRMLGGETEAPPLAVAGSGHEPWACELVASWEPFYCMDWKLMGS